MSRHAPTRRRRAGAAEEPASGADPPGPVGFALHRKGRPTGFVLAEPTASWTLGRGAGVDLCFDDEGVSRLHAHLKFEAGVALFTDARSANGTFFVDAAQRSVDVGGAGNEGVLVPRDDDALSTEAGRLALFSRARLVLPTEPLALFVGDVVFLGDAHAALEALDATTAAQLAARSASVLVGPPPQSTAGTRFAHELKRAARAQGLVLLLGPSGSGKTWAARAIHETSGRPGRFLSLNAAALPAEPTQLRSVLLGHKKGAFTGALHDVEGAWTAADHGSLFLDEIDSLHPVGQAFLLTLLEQSGDLFALGERPDARPVRRDVRVIAASKGALHDAQLRPDLAWRLVDGAIVEVPTLADRREDVPQIVASLLDDLRREDGVAADFDDDAIAACAAADWPGQVRQLRSIVRVLARETLLEGRSRITGDDVRRRLASQARALGTRPSASPPPTSRAPSAVPPMSLRKKARTLTVDDISCALNAAGGNIQRAAESLDVARNTFVKKMDAFGLSRPRRLADSDQANTDVTADDEEGA
jgi:DNA-binding NtrC family response regulator